MAIANLPSNVPSVMLKEVLTRAQAYKRISYVFNKIKMGVNTGASAILTRFINAAVTTTPETEGQNPVTQAPQTESFTATIRRYSAAFATSTYNATVNPIDWAKQMAGLLYTQIDMVRERVRWNAAISGTNVIYNSPAITQTSDVNGVLTLGRLQKAGRSISNAKGQTFTSESMGSNREGTAPNEAGFIVLCHTDAEDGIRNLPNFRPRAAMTGANYPMGTFGCVDNFVFLTSPEFVPDLGAGAATTTLNATGGNADVYSFVVCAKDAFTEVDLAGAERGGFGNAKVNVLDKADKSDPTNARLIVSAAWYDEALPTSDDWSVRIECGVIANPA